MSQEDLFYQGRRIVTGHDAAGASVALAVEAPPHSRTLPGARFHEIWGTDSSPAPITSLPAEEPTSDRPAIHPREGGSAIRIIDFLPAGRGGVRSPMHRTSTIDYGIVLEGEMVLILTDSEVALKAGDVVVQRGTDHAWENRTDRIARMAFVLLHGEFSAELRAKLPDLHLMA